MKKLFKWLDENILFYLSVFLLAFIPLYPKIPLLDLLPGYIVRLRLEDLFVAFTIFIYFSMTIRKKVNPLKNPLFIPLCLYIIAGIMSIFSGIFIVKTIPFENIHIGKSFLHFIRRVEYFSLFFIFFSSIKSIKHIKISLSIFTLTVFGVVVYGFGQKYLYWPAFSTMNREFAKGWMLYLTEHARVLSTFGGHYDLAAFIMMALIIFWSLFYSTKKIIYKIFIFILIAGAFWTLILTASRTSFLAYLAGLAVMFFFWSYKKGIQWSVFRGIFTIFLSIVVMLSFGDLSERFTKLLRIDERLSGIKAILLKPIGKPPENKAYFLENNEAILEAITSKSDQPPSIRRPSDVYEDIPLNIATSGGIINVKRTYSQTAFKYDLSTAIRFDALWPMAISGFKKNPIFGSGYATLNKKEAIEFTEAESTDNDYLRALGETGLFGFLTYFGALFLLLYFVWRNISIINDPLILGIVTGFTGVLFGLLVNAMYIDVFESSKVAFSFWSISGIVLASIELSKKNHKDIPKPKIPNLMKNIQNLKHRLIKFFKSDIFILIILILIALFLRLYKINTPLADWHSWRQADTSSVTRNFTIHGINVLYPTFDDLSNIPSGKDNPRGLRMVEFPLYNVVAVFIDKLFVGFNVEFSGRLTNIFLSLGSLIFIFLISRKYLGRFEAVVAGLLFAVLPYSIFYSRVILPEPMLVFSSLGGIYFIDKFTEIHGNKKYKLKYSVFFIISLLFMSAALLVKPTAVFFFLPIFYLLLKKFGLSIKFFFYLAIVTILPLIPFILWRKWISQFPEGIPAYQWLLNGDGIRFKGAFFYWLFADRLTRMMLGYWGVSLFLMGFLDKNKKEGLLFKIWIFAMFLYVAIFATGNVRHDYYQIITMPIIVIFFAKGASFILKKADNLFQKFQTLLLIILIIIFSFMFSWYHIRDFYNINHPEIVEAGSVVERKTHNKALVIAPYNGDTAFLYQTKRSGWPIVQGSIDELIQKGADYYVSVQFDELTQNLIKEATLPDESKRIYKLVDLTDKYVIIQLVPDKNLPK